MSNVELIIYEYIIVNPIWDIKKINNSVIPIKFLKKTVLFGNQTTEN